MPPRNMRGGKGYKKGKRVIPDREGSVRKFQGREEGQDYARVVRMLGNRRVICFCNDGAERICKIRGALCEGPKRQRIQVGDIVLVCFREFESRTEACAGSSGGNSETTENAMTLDTGRKEIADLVEKCSQSNWRDIRREEGIHKNLFLSISNGGAQMDEDLFGSEGDGESNSEGGVENETLKKVEEEVEEEEIDVDAI